MKISKRENHKLTKRLVEGIVADATKRVLLWDTDITGFCLRVYPTGRKTYFFQYRNAQRKTKFFKIGVHGNITAEQAREKAKQLSLLVSSGEDPSAQKRSDKDLPRLTDLATDYVERHGSRKKANNLRDDKLMLKNHILPALADKRVDSVSRREIETLHLKMKNTPYHANRVLSLLSKMFSLAVAWGWRHDNPVKGIERYQEHKRTRWLDDNELERLWEVLDSYHKQDISNVIRLLLLTGSRRNEVLQATWDQFDLDKGVWTKPAHTTKQKTMEYLPLSSEAINILQAMKSDSADGFLFPGRVPGQPLREIKKSWHTIRTMAGIEDVRLHDLRHTHASHLVSSGLSLSIVGKLLGHTQVATTQRYAHLADKPLRDATELFGSKVKGFGK